MWMYVSELRLARFWSAFGMLKCHLYALNVACHPEYKPPGYPNTSTCKSQGNKNFRVVATLPYADPHSSLATLFSALHFAFIFFVRLFFCCLLLAAAAKICSPHTISPPNFPSSICHFLIRLKFIFYPLNHFCVLFLFGFNFVLHFSFPWRKAAKMLTRSLARGQGSDKLYNCHPKSPRTSTCPPPAEFNVGVWQSWHLSWKNIHRSKFKHK